ncbi:MULTISPECIES: acyl-CoA dehydrogenase family protein [Gordonia]|jgi:alkylation response protein AidB-like acyl-CoA dehydrogenase|uniref:Acyl-CoA dehydrogenase FadE34 n=1 Tax=Gordonia insulae TaxID=2420509 RepID=A0A3G8JLV6_9ACTN|nr:MULTISPECIES: acyl-CoA dehydrogenase family protein [Gordonia]ASR03116.1 Acryloyl-CoA reductase (NADH) [Gordonia rubripertincta]AZG45429.1 Acyl-CoA dehydrogenase FadE34 [Gordonia insulae]
MPVTTQAERRELRSAVRDFLESVYPPLSSETRVGAGDKLDDATWARVSGEIGLPGLVVPASEGGQDLGVTEAAVVLEETARVLFAQPFLSSSVLATIAIKESGEGAAFLSRLASGSLIATLCLDDDPDMPVTATRVDTCWQLNGAKELVLDATLAGSFVVSVALDGETALLLVDADQVTIEPYEGIDLTRTIARVRFDAAPAIRLGGDQTELVARLGHLGAVAASAELTGLADRAMTMAVEYAQTRVQFGRPIGSFQAVKHLCADMLTIVESSRAATAAAAASADDRPDELAVTAAIAKAWTSEQCPLATELLIQILGGTGYTWEHPAHLLLRRARTLAVTFGDAADHRERLAELLAAR